MHATIRRNIAEAAETMPAEEYAFRPTPDVRTFGEILGHVANANFLFCSQANGVAPPSTSNLEKLTGKGAMLKAVLEELAYCDAVYQATTDSSFNQPATVAGLGNKRRLSDTDLLAELTRLVARERDATVHVIAALMEVEARRLYRGEGCPSLFVYCTDVLHFSEHAAYLRIEAARAALRIPRILEFLADGSLTLTTVGLLKPHLTKENHRDLLEAARHKSKRDVEKMMAALRPLPAVPSTVRKLPAPKAVEPASPAAPAMLTQGAGDRIHHAPDVHPAPPAIAARPAVVTPLAPERYKVQVTISRDAHDKLRRAQELLRHTIPSGDPAAIFERALALLVDDLERKRCAAAKTPRPPAGSTPGSRHVPAAVKRDVWARDEGRCAFVGALGRCPERGLLELHHVVPFADGGGTDAANLQLRCRAHNAFEAEAWFGREEMQSRRNAAPTRSGPS